MLESIKNFFRSSMSPPPEEPESRKDLRLAACALLLELAQEDGGVAHQGHDLVNQVGVGRGHLSCRGGVPHDEEGESHECSYCHHGAS